MSVTTAATVSECDAPFHVTAEINVTALGTAFLRVTVDGERLGFEINPHLLKLHDTSVTSEAERLLQRHAGYKSAADWTTHEHGRMTATVTEITGRCITCVHGCGCELGSTGCGHYRCPAATAEIAHTCDGAALAIAAKRPSYRRRSTARTSR